ncbi:hypothetical protein [Streptomyces sp. SLBN-31]|uniref:hypothetical protein n=1 Tax=Streptomyces sp. SLBN-31 TaxID=2768444 RepID=UPI0021B1BFD0|nr:hypothetical protein [Streptomyces sp. SLBN-31]
MTPFQLVESANAPCTSTTVGFFSLSGADVVLSAWAGATAVAMRAVATEAVARRESGVRTR